MSRQTTLVIALSFGFILEIPLPILADDLNQEEKLPPRITESDFDLEHDADRKRNLVWPPLASFFFPGFDQWWEQQEGYAMAYSGAGLFGIAYATRSFEPIDTTSEEGKAKARERQEDFKDTGQRHFALGLQLYQAAGGMSLYHSFRSGVRSHQKSGDFSFLTHEESPADLLWAPFEPKYLLRPTTLIPLGVGVLYSAWVLARLNPEGVERDRFGAQDAYFTAAYSYNAGTHEEAVFRGWMLPMMYDALDNQFAANNVTSLAFVLAHLGTNALPLPQLILGWHLGYVTQNDQWRIGEAIFIHAWWDVIAFYTQYRFAKAKSKLENKHGQYGDKSSVKPRLWLPPLSISF